MNLAGNFFKDIKENSSINQLGSKIKNISQSNWLPETKELLNLQNEASKPITPTQTPKRTNVKSQHSYQEDEPVYEKKSLPQQTTTQSRAQKQTNSKTARSSSYRSPSPDTPPEPAQAQIDPLQYNALLETNQALKIELQRLSIVELNQKKLEQDKLDLEKKYSLLDSNNKILDEKLKTCQTKLEKFELDNSNLKNKIKDLNKLNEEYESNLNKLKQKESILEKENKNLENELDRLSEKNTNNEMHSQKLQTIEQANKILEKELESLREQQKTERAKVKEKMDLLNSKQNEKIKKLQDENLDLASLNSNFLKEIDSLKKRVQELELAESKSSDLEKELNNLNKKYFQDKEILNREKSLIQKHENEMKNLEIILNNLKHDLNEKENDLLDMKQARESETENYLKKLSILNEENMNLNNQLKLLNSNKEEDLVKIRKKINELNNENEKLSSQLKSYQNLENDLVDVTMKSKNLQELNNQLKSKLEETETKLGEIKSLNQNLQLQIKQLRQELTSETLKNENMNADQSLLKLELNKLESYKQKCEHLEKELNDLKNLKSQRLNDFEVSNRKYNESSDKYEYEIKLLNTQLININSDLKVKEQECKQLEKLLETERNKTSSLIRQMDELNSLNTQLTMQNSDAKRRLVSLDLLTEECNQLRKNLTLMTIESESRKAEVTTLNSQIGILENTIKSLRDTCEKHSQLETNYENAVYELKKKQEDFKKLQQVHETIKKEQSDTIEILEEKLKDVEKKTELQALKHEEILLELESIRARRERLLPLCPNCSSQQYPMYQSVQPSQSQSPQPQLNTTQTQPQQAQLAQNAQTYLPQNQLLPSQQLLSIAIPQQPLISPIISPLQLHNLSQLQLIALPGKQSVTVDCQTSPLIEQEKFDFKQKKLEIEQKAIEEYKKLNIVQKINSFTQTVIKKFENKEVLTEPVEFKDKTSQNKILKTFWSQATNCNLYSESKTTSSTQTGYLTPKAYEDKSVQFETEIKILKPQKYNLYTCKYNYDPLKNSPNDNPHAELPLTAGDYLFILNEQSEDGFYNGELLNGKQGLIPSNFVEKISLDQTGINKFLENLPKNVLFNQKFIESLTNMNINIGQVIMSAQEQIQKLQQQTQIVPTKQTVVSKSDKLILPNPIEDNSSMSSSIKIGLPYPNNLKVEKRSDTSLLVTWDPPTAPLPINQSIETDNNNNNNNLFDLNEQNVVVQSYNLYLNHELHSIINGNDERVAILEEIDLSGPNRISIQAVGNNAGGLSKPQECTLLFGSNRSFAPSGLTIHNLTQTSAVVSWWPSSSLYSHIISIDSIEHRTLKPGIYRFKLSGLLPDTSHLVTITAQIPNHVNESTSNYEASVEFRTLPSKTLGVPQNLMIEKDSNEVDTYLLSWQPVVSMPNTVSNGIPVGGYSIYLDGIRVHQILNPIASNCSLSGKLLFNGAKLLTIRTLSLDGNAESKDSEGLKLNKSLVANKSKPTLLNNKNESINQSSQNNQSIESSTSSLFSTSSTSKKQIVEPKPNPQPHQQQTNTVVSQAQVIDDSSKSIQKPIPKPAQTEPKKQTSINNPILNQIPKISDANRKKSEIKSNFENDSDLYENNNRNQSNNPSSSATTTKKKTSRQGSPNNLVNAKTINSNKTEPSKIQKINSKAINNSKSEKNYRLFIALFDYDPFKMSPNTDSCQEELPFKEGQLIKIFGEQDSDGFYYGESNGRSGYIPCNMVSEVQVDDSEVVNKLLEPNSNSGANETNDNKTKRKNSATGSKLNTSKTSKPVSNTTKPSAQKKEQSFVPINNYKSQSQKKCVMIALYDYDPQSLSPNADADVELPFKTGEIITVYGDMDEDGFYMGELNGKRGLVPSNFLQPVQDQDHYNSDKYAFKSGEPIKK